MSRLAIAAAMLLLTTTSSYAQNSGYYYDGNKLHGFCSGGDDLSLLQCNTYVAGALDTIPDNCIPVGTHLGAVTDVVTRYIVQHPEHRIYNAAAVVHYAISEVWGTPGACR